MLLSSVNEISIDSQCQYCCNCRKLDSNNVEFFGNNIRVRIYDYLLIINFRPRIIETTDNHVSINRDSTVHWKV